MQTFFRPPLHKSPQLACGSRRGWAVRWSVASASHGVNHLADVAGVIACAADRIPIDVRFGDVSPALTQICDFGHRPAVLSVTPVEQHQPPGFLTANGRSDPIPTVTVSTRRAKGGRFRQAFRSQRINLLLLRGNSLGVRDRCHGSGTVACFVCTESITVDDSPALRSDHRARRFGWSESFRRQLCRSRTPANRP